MLTHTIYIRSFLMKKHLLALLSVGSLVAMLPGCGSCCDGNKQVRSEEVVTESSSEVAATEAEVVSGEVIAQDAVEATPAAEDKH